MTPVPAASVLLLRDRPAKTRAGTGYEILMLRRHARMSFVPGAWVFPGGTVDAADKTIAAELGDESELGVMRVAAARELFEESGIWLAAPLAGAAEKRRLLLSGAATFGELLAESPVDLGQLVWTSRWITPSAAPKRFDTWFFLAVAPPDAVGTVSDDESVEAGWFLPEVAVRTLELVFPTVKNLEAVMGYGSAGAIIDTRRKAVIEPVRPRLIDGKIVLP